MSNRLSRFPYVVPVLLVFAAALAGGCSDDNGPTEPGPGDTTPPTVSSVTARDRTSFEVQFSEAVDRPTAENRNNYQVTLQGVVPKQALAPGDTLHVEQAALLIDGMTVLLTVNPDMVGGENYDVRVQNVKDTSGNAMSEPSTTSVMGSGDPDTTIPTITSRSPAANQTGVGIGQSVNVTFSEPMESGTVESAFHLSGPGGDVPVNSEQVGVASYTFQPVELLAMSTKYTAAFAAGTARDLSGNFLTGVSWDFTTTNQTDNTRPTLVSTTPANEATGVALDIVFRLEFSEPIDPASLDGESIILTPDVGDGTPNWVDGGKTLTFDPDSDLLENTSYNLIIVAGAVRDLAGNPLEGTTSVTFTTATSLPTGAISGTISGDSRSAVASDPEGTLVAAFLIDLFGDGSGEGNPPIGGVDLADNMGDYSVLHLKDGVYWPAAFLDADGDGEISPEKGDAIGIYGVDLTQPVEPVAASVSVSGGIPVSGIDFGLYDMMGIWGEVSYGGSAYAGNLEGYEFYAGLIDTTGFDPDNPGTPVLGTNAQSIVYNREYIFNELDDGLQAGTYYVGAYLDVNPGDGDGYNPDVDPAGFYLMDGEPATVTVMNGSDGKGIDIVLNDPPAGSPSGRVTGSWSAQQSGGSAWGEVVRRAAEAARLAAE